MVSRTFFCQSCGLMQKQKQKVLDCIKLQTSWGPKR